VQPWSGSSCEKWYHLGWLLGRGCLKHPAARTTPRVAPTRAPFSYAASGVGVGGSCVQTGSQGHSSGKPNAIAAFRRRAQQRAGIYVPIAGYAAADARSSPPSRFHLDGPQGFSLCRALIVAFGDKPVQLADAALHPGARAEPKVDGLARLSQSRQQQQKRETDQHKNWNDDFHDLYSFSL
jgi:hypothetical protein